LVCALEYDAVVASTVRVVVKDIVMNGDAVAILAVPRIIAEKKVHTVVLENIVSKRDVSAGRSLTPSLWPNQPVGNRECSCARYDVVVATHPTQSIFRAAD
jgi:hypothetical protein